MNRNIISTLIEIFSSNSESVLIECELEPLNGTQIINRIISCQQQLIQQGITRESRIVVFSGRGNDFWIEVMSLWGLGAVVIPLDPSISKTETQNVLRKSQPSAYLGEPENCDFDTINRIENAKSDTNRPEQDPICVEVDDQALGSILFTSGSTGEPKGVMLTHEAIRGNAQATKAAFELDSRKKLLAPIPFRFVSSLSHFIATLYNNVCYCGTERKLLKTELLELLEQTQADAFGGSPVQIRWIAELADQYNINLKWFMSSGDNLPKQTILAIQEKIPDIKIVTAYGLTEVAGRFCILPPSQTAKNIGSVGQPINGLSVKIRDDNKSELPVNEQGQVFVSGRYLFKGYINDPDKTADSLTSLGFSTGDIGHIDEQGNLYLSGRTDDVFKSGGLKVSTLPIAATLMNSGVFEDIAVMAEKDEILSHVPIVYYKLKSGFEFEKGPLMRALRKELPPGHLPRRFVPIDNIPRTGSGKIKRGELKKIIAQLD